MVSKKKKKEKKRNGSFPQEAYSLSEREGSSQLLQQVVSEITIKSMEGDGGTDKKQLIQMVSSKLRPEGQVGLNQVKLSCEWGGGEGCQLMQISARKICC